MNRQTATQTHQQKPTATPAASGLLQRKCACGNHTMAGGECKECGKKKRLGLQTKLTINEPGDIYEQESDRIADQVMATPAHTGVSGAPPRIQRLVGQPTGQMDAAPASVDQAHASPGRPLEPALRQDMEQRFGYDFSLVRVHTDAKAAESARVVSARAYTVGQDIVFAESEFDPGVEVGRTLLAHELAHTVQQSASAVGAVSEGQAIRIEPPGTSLERAAQEHSARSSGGSGTLAPIDRVALQRQPAPQPQAEAGGESLFTIFVANEARKTDKRFARTQALADAARIRKSGTLSTDERQLVRAKLRFFEGDAWQTYSDTIRPALVEVTQEEIQMEGDDFGGGAAGWPKPKAMPGDVTARLKMMRGFPEYIDNNIKEVNYFTAELAVIHYQDGSKFELGLVPKWMKSPVVEVDCNTPIEDFRPIEDATGRFGFFVESEMAATAPRTMPYQDLLKTYGRYIDFFLEKGTVRIVPSRINMLTAPTLCKVIRDSEKQYDEQVKWVAHWGTEVAKVIPGMGAGGFGGRAAVEANVAGRIVGKQAASRAMKVLTEKMDDLLAASSSKTFTVEGVVFENVVVKTQGSRLAVRRFRIERVNAAPGQGSVMSEAFEDAAVAVARRNGMKSVTIDVGVIVNPGWREWLESLGYVFSATEGGWIKTIKL